MDNEECLYFNKVRIIVVDDSQFDREILVRRLELIGCNQIVEVADCFEALVKIEDAQKAGKRFHILITDWNMPEMDGYQFVTYLKKNIKVKINGLKVVIHTAVDDEMKIKDMLKLGIDDYIIKNEDQSIIQDKILKLTQKIFPK